MRKSEEDRIYRRSLAYRAKLHTAILEIQRYANGLISYNFNKNVHKMPIYPHESFSVIEEITEYIDAQSAEYINHMLDCHQKILRNASNKQLRLAEADVVIFRAFTNKLFDYCEGIIDKLPQKIKWDDIRNIQRLNSQHISDDWISKNINPKTLEWQSKKNLTLID